MHRPNLERTVAAAVFSLLVASLLLVGTAPASAQSKPNGQGIPQQISALEQQVATLNQQVATLSREVGALSAPSNTFADQLAAFDRRLTALDERLSGLTPGGGGKVLRVVDANGAEIGPMISTSEVIRKIGESWLLLGVWPDGFMESSPIFFNDRADCQGAIYMQVFPGLLKQTSVVRGVAYYASAAPQPVMVAAYHRLFAGGGSACEPFASPIEQSVSEVATADLSAFVTPFAVRYDQ